MRCTSPRTVGFYDDGKTLCWSPKKYSKQYPPFQIPCGKCIACRMQRASETAIRCVHEAQMHENNSFITLTYSDEHIGNNKLNYKHFQDFIKRLRSHIYDNPKDHLTSEEPISYLATGEYGDKTKRMHWHAVVFNWRPSDCVSLRTSDLGDKIYTSPTLEELWAFNDRTSVPNQIGSVDLRSAGYVARYSLKKLSHGKDGEHSYDPISRRSTGRAIGRSFLEKYYKDIFNNGFVEHDGKLFPPPRYYEKWLKKEHPDFWKYYVTEVKPKIIADAVRKEEKITNEEKKVNMKRAALMGLSYKAQRTRKETQRKILELKRKKLEEHQKL